MPNVISRFNLYLFSFIFFILLIAIFNLYQKQFIENDSTISDWIINYQGGFTRRGLIGEICFALAKRFDISLRVVIFIFQSILYTLYSVLIYNYLKNVPKNFITIFAIFSPIFLLYPISEIEVLARKEIFLFVGFIIFLNFSAIKINKYSSLIYVFFIFPILCLIWEPFIFFIPFAVIVLLIQNNDDSFTSTFNKLLLSFSSSVFVTIYIIFNLLTPDGHEIMKQSLLENFNENCYMSCDLLGTKSSISAQFKAVIYYFNFKILSRYILIFLIGFLPFFIICFNSKLNEKIIFFNKNHNLLLIILILLIPSLILFASATDWGRWINICYTFAFLFYSYLVKNNIITTNNKISNFDNYILNKKKYF